VAHRDIKPQNLFLAEDPRGFRVKLVDFGLAKSLVETQDLTRTGMVLGTPAYMSPEQVAGGSVSPRSDLYSLAVVGYEALTGQRLVATTSLGEAFSQILHLPAPPPSTLRPGLPQAVDAAFASALAKDPAQRPRDVEAWAEGFAPLLETIEAREPGWPARFVDALVEGEDTTASPLPEDAPTVG